MKTNKQISRRGFITRLLATFTFSITIVGLYGQPEENGTFSFLHISDAHIIQQSDWYHPVIAKARNHYANGVKPLLDFLSVMPVSTGSEMVILTGDMIDFYEAEDKEGNMDASQIEQFLQLLADKPVPVYMTLGNHDIASYPVRDGKLVPDQLCSSTARATWIRKSECFSQGTWYSKRFSVGKAYYCFLFLDDADSDNLKGKEIIEPYMGVDQLAWLENQLAQSSDEYKIILMHIPFEQEYENTKNELYSLLSRYPSVKLILAGHNHRNLVTKFSSSVPFIQVETAAFSRDVNNWRQIYLTEKNISVSLPGSKQIEINIDL